MLSNERRRAVSYFVLKPTMDYYPAFVEVVGNGLFLCYNLFFCLYLQCLDAASYKLTNFWDMTTLAVFSINPRTIEFCCSQDLALMNFCHLTSPSFSTHLHDITPSWPMTYKLTLALAFLIAVRGCLPRYRYDFLTKLGWVKFLGQTLTFFLTTTTMIIVA